MLSSDTWSSNPTTAVVEEVTLGVGIGALGRGQVAQTLAQRGDDPGELGSEGLHVGAQRLLGCVGDVVGEGFDEGTVGGAEVLVATTQ